MRKKSTLDIILLILLSFIFTGCFEIFNFSDERYDSNFKSWTTEVINDSMTILKIEFFKEFKVGNIYLYSPYGDLIDSKILNYSKNVSFIISSSKMINPYVGNYSFKVTDYDNNIILSEVLSVKDSQLIIKDCVPIWVYNEVFDHVILESINLTIYNDGDLFGDIWEGKFIIDNSSNFGAPDYHWHDLDIWIGPRQKISIPLPADVPGLNTGEHFFVILLRDNNLDNVSYYENSFLTPNWFT